MAGMPNNSDGPTPPSIQSRMCNTTQQQMHRLVVAPVTERSNAQQGQHNTIAAETNHDANVQELSSAGKHKANIGDDRPLVHAMLQVKTTSTDLTIQNDSQYSWAMNRWLNSRDDPLAFIGQGSDR